MAKYIKIGQLKAGDNLIYCGEVYRVQKVTLEDGKYRVKFVGARVPLVLSANYRAKVQ